MSNASESALIGSLRLMDSGELGMQFGDFRLSVIRECQYKLDGGALFGVVPKVLWSKVAPADDSNRVPLACNLLLIQTSDANVLIETGMGPRWSERERERFELQLLIDHRNAVAEAGLRNDEITHVILSHMHFDHMGGAVIEENGKLVPAFANAKYFVQKGEYELAGGINARGKASYRIDDYKPIEEHGQLVKLDGDTEIVPGIWTRITGGHTSHHQIITFQSGNKKGVFFADIIPTHGHIQPPWVMGYDHYPLHSCDIKDEWLSRAAAEQWLVVFDHEVGVPWGYVSKSAGKFAWHPLAEDTLTSPTATLPDETARAAV